MVETKSRSSKVQERMLSTVSFFRGCRGRTNATSYGTIEQFLSEMFNPSSGLREFTSRRPDKASDPKGYQAWKEGTPDGREPGCPAIIPGQFETRSKKGCKKYSPLMVFDVDALEGEDVLPFYIEQCRKSKHIFAAWPSPGMAGLRILVWTGSQLDTRKAYHAEICKRLARLLDIETKKEALQRLKQEGLSPSDAGKALKATPHVDDPTGNLGRVWFYTAVPQNLIYINEDSETFYLEPKQEKRQKQEPVKISESSPVPDDVKVELCRRKVTDHQGIIPAEHNRNNFVFSFACEMARHGVDQTRAMSECLAYSEPGFEEDEIRKTVANAYRSRKQEFFDKEIRSYLKNGEAVKNTQTSSPLPTPAAEGPGEEEDDGEKKDKPSDENRLKGTSSLTSYKAKRIEKELQHRWDFRFNVITRMPEFRLKGENDYQRMDDYALNSITRKLRLLGTPGASRTRIAETIESGFAPMVNPIEEYFRELEYDGEDHIANLCNTVATIEGEEEMFRKYFEKWLVGAVANVFIKHKCANHMCFILTSGEQGFLKSTWIRMLCPPPLIPYYIQGSLDPDNKDDLFATTANFIYNLDDDLSEITKKKINALKALITKDTVNARRPYSRYPEDLPKICSFIGSANEETFLHDPTGNRRFVPFEVTQRIDIESVKAININQVWAQAYKLFKEGFTYWLSHEDQQELSEHNTKYEVQSLEYELVTKYFEKPKTRQSAQETMVIADIIDYLSNRSQIRIIQRKVGEALKKAGFERFQVRKNGNRQWVYALNIVEEEDQEKSPPHTQKAATKMDAHSKKKFFAKNIW